MDWLNLQNLPLVCERVQRGWIFIGCIQNGTLNYHPDVAPRVEAESLIHKLSVTKEAYFGQNPLAEVEEYEDLLLLFATRAQLWELLSPNIFDVVDTRITAMVGESQSLLPKSNFNQPIVETTFPTCDPEPDWQ